jgi:hypothetical protein
MSSLTTTDRSGHQDILVNVLKTIAGRADAYFWHFNGENDDGYNKGSLSHLLGIDHDDMVLIMEKCGYMDAEKKVDRSQLDQLADRIGKKSCEVIQSRLTIGDGRKVLYFLRIGNSNRLHSFAAPRLLFKKDVLVEFPKRSNYPWLQLVTDEIRLLIKSLRKEEENPDPPLHDEEIKGRKEQTGARGEDKDGQEQTKSLSDFESEMIKNIVTTISGEDKPTITQRQFRSIRKYISRYMVLFLSNLDSAITTTAPQQENDEMIADMITTDADTPPQPDSAVDNCNIEEKETLKYLFAKNITRRNRTFIIERHNGKDTVIVARPFSKDSESFVVEADRSKWVDNLLPDATYVDGMCMYLARKHSDTNGKFACSRKVRKKVTTEKTSNRIQSRPREKAA